MHKSPGHTRSQTRPRPAPPPRPAASEHACMCDCSTRLFLHVDDGHGIVQQREFHRVVLWSIRRERRAGVDLDEPWLERRVDEDVVAVELEGLAVVDDDFLDRQQRPHAQQLDVEEQSVDALDAVLRHEVELEAAHVPFAAALRVVVVAFFLDRYVR